MQTAGERIVQTLIRLDPLANLPRTGFLMRGIRPCESIADHSFGVALCVMLLVDAARAQGLEVDGERALRMALVHDAPEAALGDVPSPVKSPELDEALTAVERTLVERLVPPPAPELWDELEAAETLEARIVRVADKLQMMVKVLIYERQGRRGLDAFWENPKNQRDYDLGFAAEAFARVRELRTADRGG